ncbi:MAG TPA: hypothetical protein PK156_33495 [Polyangium sp.]|nr:hypothetical protein [Polyangium sp.]
MREYRSDADCVDAWMKTLAANPPSLAVDALLRHFQQALDAIWHQAHEPLGEVTLNAIAARVLFISKERFPGLSGINIGRNGISLDELQERTNTLRPPELSESLRFLLTELLRVLGVLTANVLTPWLHAELSKIALPQPDHADADDEAVPMHPVSPEGEEA